VSASSPRRLGRRQLLSAAGSAGVLGLAPWLAGCRRGEDAIKIGILQSLSGTMAVSEASLRDAAMMAIEEVNAAGGVLGKSVVAIVEDPASSAARFQERAEKLLAADRVCSVFGCWTSLSRKAVLPIFEKHDGLLWYPVQYEGGECTRNVIYTGSSPNQQILPALAWLRSTGRRRYFLLGSDYVYPRTANRIVRRYVDGVGDTVVGESYVPLGSRDFEATVREVTAARPDVIFSTINGGSNLAFYKQLASAGVTARDIPVMAMSVAEVEVRSIANEYTTGHLAAWSYFQSVDTPENARFVRSFKDRYGARRVTSDAIEAAYFQVHLWAQSVRKAGSTAPDAIRAAAAGQELAAPQGLVSIDPENRHTWKRARIGEIQADGQFKVLDTSADRIAPQPWDAFLGDGQRCDWKTGRTSR